MRVRDIMTISCITAPATMPVLEARQLMLEKRIRHLLVTDGPKLLGIVTDRDIRLNLPSPATSLSVWEINYLLTKLTVGDVMTKAVITVEPERPIEEAARLLLEHRIGALPVVEDGRLGGILTETDLLRAFVYSQSAAPQPAAVGPPVTARG